MQESVKKLNLNGSIHVKAVKTKYPQGAEKQLIFALTGRKVPSGSIPMDIGAVVLNVGTLFSVREAVYLASLYSKGI